MSAKLFREWVETDENISQIAISKLISINVYKSNGSWSADIFYYSKVDWLRDFKSSGQAKEAALTRALEIIRDGESQILTLLGRIIEIKGV